MSILISSRVLMLLDMLTIERSVWWSSAHTYKNAITNQLFLHTSANLYNRFGDSTYLANAQKVITPSAMPNIREMLTIYSTRRGLGVSMCSPGNDKMY